MKAKNGVIEILEARIAPAAVFTYIDVDGDIVSVKTSRGSKAQLESILVLSPGGVGEQLQTIDFSANARAFAGTSLTVTAHPGPLGGDGRANVGYIDATNSDGGASLDLMSISIQGDLGRINAGDRNAPTPAVASLKSVSMGEFGVSTQAAGGTLASNIYGAVRRWSISDDVGPVNVKLTDNISVNAHLSRMTSLTVGGSLTGTFNDDGGFDAVNIGGDISGGSIVAVSSLLSLNVGGSIVGGSANFSGSVNVAEILNAKVGGDLIGGSGRDSGVLFGLGDTSSFFGGRAKIGGSVKGGAGDDSGFIAAGNASAIAVAGDVIGGGGSDSGEIEGTRMASVSVGGSLVGGEGADSGTIYGDHLLLNVIVGHNVVGGSGPISGLIRSDGSIGNVDIAGSLVGGSGPAVDFGPGLLASSGSVVCLAGSIGFVRIGGSVTGGLGEMSGSVLAGKNIQAVSIHGNVDSASAGGTASFYAANNIGVIDIGGDISGAGSYFGQPGPAAAGKMLSLMVRGSIFGPVTISDSLSQGHVGRSLVADDNGNSGALFVNGAGLTSLVIGGSVKGTVDHPALIAVEGRNPDLTAGQAVAIGSLKIGGSVERAEILAGYREANGILTADNPDTVIGKVKVRGDWIASSLASGAMKGADGEFGTSDDGLNNGEANNPAILSRIAQIVISGEVLGDPAGGSHFGFVAQEIDSFMEGNIPIVLQHGPGNDQRNIGGTLDTTILEIA